MRELAARILALFRRKQFEDRLAEEMALHLELEQADLERRGLSQPAARHAAMRKFGGLEQSKEVYRDRLGFAWFDALRQDLRFTRRSLAKSPGFVFTAVTILALAIGVNTALFTFFDGYVLKPIPIPDAQRNFEVYAKRKGMDTPHNWSYADYRQIRGIGSAFEDSYAYADRDVPVRDPEPRTAHAVFVSGNYFSILGGKLAMGRPILPADDEVPGRDAVLVLSHSGWQRLFHGDAFVVGKTVRIRQRVFTVVGVTDPQFSGSSPVAPDLWMPIAMHDKATLADPESCWLYLGGLLKPGMTAERAHDSLLALVRGWNSQHPSHMAIYDIWLYSRATYVPMRPDLLAMVLPVFGLFGLILLIACADLANLLLARAAARRREIAIRLALGASRWRLVRQLLTESLLLAGVGAGIGYLLTQELINVIQGYVFSLYNQLGYSLQPLTMDWRVFLYAAGIGSLAGVAFGLAPALEATSLDLSQGVKQEGATVSVRSRPRRITDLLVTGQVAASLVLMVLAGLLIRDAQHVAQLQPGYNLDTLVDVALDGPKQKLVERLKTDPRFASFTEIWRTPLYGNLKQLPAIADGKAAPLGYSYVDDQYFATMSIPIARGRNFARTEMTTNARVAIVSASTANGLWGNTDPLGKIIQVGDPHAGDRFTAGLFQVIGVAGDVASGGLYLGNDPTSVYFPAVAGDSRNSGLIVHIQGPVPAAVAELRRVCAEFDGASSCAPRTLREVAWLQVFPYKIAGNVASWVGLLALVLTCVGLYGVVAFAVQQRTREIGVRMALGASRINVLGLVLRRSVRQVTLGVAIGIPFCLALSKYTEHLLFMLKTFDVTAYIATPLVLAAIAIAASYLPARRATAVDPMIVLREE